MSNLRIPLKQLMESTYSATATDEPNTTTQFYLNDDINNFNSNSNNNLSNLVVGYGPANYVNNNLNYTNLLNPTTAASVPYQSRNQSPNHFQHSMNNNNMNSNNNNNNNNNSTNSVTFRQMMHRPSVRSISETPNVIGAQAIDENYDICTYILTGITWLSIVLFFPLSIAFIFRVVQEYERAVIFRLGRLRRSSCGPGVILVLPCIETMSKVDMRTVSFDVAPQEVLTKDSVTVAVDAVVYYRVFNPAVSVANVENAQESTRLLAQTSLRNVLGQKSLSEILSDRESVSRAMRECLDEATDPWGIEVERVEFKDVRLPVQLQRAMATEAEAAREARAKVIAAEGEQRAAKALKGAADIIAQSPCAIQLRYLQTLSNIATEKNSTIIFPVPVELLRVFGGGGGGGGGSGGGGGDSGGGRSSSVTTNLLPTGNKSVDTD